MAYEVELKAYLTNPTKIEAQAAQIGTFLKETHKEDVYFRPRGDGRAMPTDRYRLRREGGQAVVTFKNLLQSGGVEVNDEIEFVVDDAHSFYQFADRFGFEPFVVKRKISRVYEVGRVHVELNDVEHLGYFAELEILCNNEAEIAEARREVAQVLLRLGLKEADLEPRRYIELIQAAYPVQYKFVNDRNMDWPFVIGQ